MASRNPNGRGSRFPGKVGASFTMCPPTIDKVKQLAKEVGDSSSDFMEGLAREYADTYAQQLRGQDVSTPDAEGCSGPGAGPDGLPVTGP